MESPRGGHRSGGGPSYDSKRAGVTVAPPFGPANAPAAPHRGAEGSSDDRDRLSEGTREGTGALSAGKDAGPSGSLSPVSTVVSSLGRSGRTFWGATTRRYAVPSIDSSPKAWAVEEDPPRRHRPGSVASAGSTGVGSTGRLARGDRRRRRGHFHGSAHAAPSSRSITYWSIRACPWLPTEPEKVGAFEALGHRPRDPAPAGLPGSGRRPSALLSASAAGRVGHRPRHFRLRRSRPRDCDGSPAPGAWPTAKLWKALWDRGLQDRSGGSQPDAGREEPGGDSARALGRANPRPSEIEEETGREIDRIRQAILKGGCPGPPGVRRLAGLYETQRGAPEAGAATGRGRGADAPHGHMANVPGSRGTRFSVVVGPSAHAVLECA